MAPGGGRKKKGGGKRGCFQGPFSLHEALALCWSRKVDRRDRYLWSTLVHRLGTRLRQREHQSYICPMLGGKALNLYSRPLPCLTLVPTLLRLFPSEAEDLCSLLVSISILSWGALMIVYRQGLAFPGALSFLRSSTSPGSPYFSYTLWLGFPSLCLEPAWATPWPLPLTSSSCMWSLRNNWVLLCPHQGHQRTKMRYGLVPLLNKSFKHSPFMTRWCGLLTWGSHLPNALHWALGEN